jgi:hypothetical protein
MCQPFSGQEDSSLAALGMNTTEAASTAPLVTLLGLKICLKTENVLYNQSTVLKYSIVVPFHNEEDNVTELYSRLKAVMEATGATFEMIFVDDGSRDRTFTLLQDIAFVDSRWWL